MPTMLSQMTPALNKTHTQYFSTIKPIRYTNFKHLFWHETLHVSDSSSAHRQKFIHCTLSNGMCRIEISQMGKNY